MIRVISRVEAHFSLICSGVYECPTGSPKFNRLDMLGSPNPDHMWWRNLVVQTIHHVICNTWVLHKNHTPWRTFPFLARLSPSCFLVIAEHFSLEPLLLNRMTPAPPSPWIYNGKEMPVRYYGRRRVMPQARYNKLESSSPYPTFPLIIVIP